MALVFQRCILGDAQVLFFKTQTPSSTYGQHHGIPWDSLQRMGQKSPYFYGGWRFSMGESMWLDHRHQHGDGSKPIWNTLKYPCCWMNIYNHKLFDANFHLHYRVPPWLSRSAATAATPATAARVGPSHQVSSISSCNFWRLANKCLVRWVKRWAAFNMSWRGSHGSHGEPWGNHDIMGHHGFMILEQRSFQQHLRSIHIQRLVNIDQHWSSLRYFPMYWIVQQAVNPLWTHRGSGQPLLNRDRSKFQWTAPF